MRLHLALGSQLFDPCILASLGVQPHSTLIFMREDRELASYYRFHKHKIIFFFLAMRAYRQELEQMGYRVHYEEFNRKSSSFEEGLAHFIEKNKITHLSCFEIEDNFFAKRIEACAHAIGVELQIFSSPMFLCSRADFQAYLKERKRPLMKSFYETQRKNLGILVKDGKPIGGKWSFDSENRLPLPKDISPPQLNFFSATAEERKLMELVAENFGGHPGDTSDFWLPTDRRGARGWLRDFLRDRLAYFGDFEDAIPVHSEFVYHSVLTPFLNCGLLTPREVIDEALAHAQKHSLPLNSLEGFVRQVIGWREFVRGIYQNYDEIQQRRNFWHHKNKLSLVWYQGNSGIPPLDETIRRVLKRGYAHHIERLMIVGSLMVLLEIDPREAHRWFMEMFIDSSDWVMGPNVYGMALFSDGGIFATKPYICGSNYLRKMGGYAKDEWCDGVDGLYWSFIKKHEDFFLKNPRLSMIARSAKKISDARFQQIQSAANILRAKLTI